MSPNGPPSADAERPGPDRPPKRRRIALACTYCRNRKSKCDGGRPLCSFCAGLGLQCSYEHRAKSQKKSGGEYDHRLKLIEDTLQQLVQTRDDRSDGPSQATHFGAASHDDPFVLDVDNAQDSANDETRVDGLATVNGSDTDSRYFGPSSNIAFLKLVSSTTSAVLKSTVAQRWQRQHDSQQSHGDLSDGLSNVHETLTRLTSPVPAASSSSCTPSSPVSKTLTMLPAKALVLHLLDLYFSNTGVLFPFISERRVYASYHALNTKCSSESRKSLLCLLNAIFAFATLMNAKNGHPDSKNAAEADVFYFRALALIPRSYEGSSDIETVQYLILLSQYCQNTQRPEDTWFLHGLAVQAATRIGLASTSRMNAFSGVEREVRKRLWFGCFILDRTLSMTLGRPPIIQDILGNMELPLDTTLGQLDVDTSGPSGHHERPHSALFFIATIQLYKVLGSIISKLYGYNLDEEQCMFRLETTKDILLIENDLDSWKRSLPSSMLNRPWESRLSDTSPSHDAVSARLSTVTHLRYLNVRILLHRPALQHLLKQRSLLRPIIDQNQPVFDAITNASAAICRDCATQIIGIVCQLSKTMDLLGARWFSIYYTFNAALVSFSCLLLEPSRGDLVLSLKMAVEATERLDTDTQASRRVLKILHRLIEMSESLRELSLLNKDMPDLDPGLSAAALTTFLHDSSTEPCDELGLAAKTQPAGKATSHVLNTIGQTFPGWHTGDMGIVWPLDGTGDDFLGTLQF